MVLQVDKRPLSHAIVHDMNAAWIKSLAILDKLAPSKPKDRVIAGTLRVGALVETGEVAKARSALEAFQPDLAALHPRMEAASHLNAAVAKGRVLAARRER